MVLQGQTEKMTPGRADRPGVNASVLSAFIRPRKAPKNPRTTLSKHQGMAPTLDWQDVQLAAAN